MATATRNEVAVRPPAPSDAGVEGGGVGGLVGRGVAAAVGEEERGAGVGAAPEAKERMLTPKQE